MAQEQPTAAPQKQLLLQKIYVKDLSFESPKAPMVFTTNVQPQTQLNVRSSAQQVAPDTQEVTLTITVEAKDKDSTLFLAEVAQAGIFLIQGYTAEEQSILIGSFCPNTLYPFAREAISELVSKGGFPPLLLQPLNFDAIYAQAVQERATRAAAGAPGSERRHALARPVASRSSGPGLGARRSRCNSRAPAIRRRSGHATRRTPRRCSVSDATRVILPDTAFPDLLEPTADLRAAVAAADDVLIAVPSHAFRETLTALAGLSAAPPGVGDQGLRARHGSPARIKSPASCCRRACRRPCSRARRSRARSAPVCRRP